MSAGEDLVRPDDHSMVRAQLGRDPRGAWSVADRCAHGRPAVIETSPLLGDGSPFPTLYWLTCPWLREYVDGLESAGAVQDWAGRVRSDPDLSSALVRVDREYRRLRAAKTDGETSLQDVGIAGQRDPLATKCIHAHVANHLAGLADPIGAEVIAQMTSAVCPDDVCSGRLLGGAR